MTITDNFYNISITSYRNFFYTLIGIQDNIILISIFNIFVALFVTYIYSLFSIYKTSNIKDFFVQRCGNYNVIELEGNIYKRGRWDSYTDFSEKTKSLLYYISTLEITNKNKYNINYDIYDKNVKYP